MLCPMASSHHSPAHESRRGDAEVLRQEWQAWTGSFPDFMADLDRRRVPYLSHSKVATVERCPRCYYKQYVLGEPPSSDALTTGTIFHQAAAAFYLSRHRAPPGTSPANAALPPPKHPSPDEQSCLDNSLTLMVRHAWDEHEVVGVEELFFMDLAPDLAPVIGVIDLVLRSGDCFVVVDHKTSKRFGAPDADQLVLYAECTRRSHDGAGCTGAFDEYRLVPDLKRIRKPAFRRTWVPVSESCLPALVRRYRHAWLAMKRIRSTADAVPGPDCWFCRTPYVGWR